jgi:hypothetical protein
MNNKNHKAFTYVAPRVKRMSVMHNTHQKTELNQWLSSFPELASNPSVLNPAMSDSGISEENNSTAAEDRTHWLTTFVELVYVASMIKLGHYLEYERSHWAGWQAALCMFCSFWTTWVHFTGYQTYIVDSGLLEKIWTFIHCFAMLMMGGHVNSLHYCGNMAPKNGAEYTCNGYDPNFGRVFAGYFPHDDGSRRLGGSSGSTYYDYQVSHPIFLVGLALSRFCLSLMYGIAASGASARYRKILRVPCIIFATATAALLTAACITVDHTAISVDHAVITMFTVMAIECVCIHLLATRPSIFGIAPSALAELNEDCDVEHVAHNLGQFLFIVIGEILINTVSFITEMSTWHTDHGYVYTFPSHPFYENRRFAQRQIWFWVLSVLFSAFLLAVGYFDSVPHQHAEHHHEGEEHSEYQQSETGESGSDGSESGGSLTAGTTGSRITEERDSERDTERDTDASNVDEKYLRSSSNPNASITSNTWTETTSASTRPSLKTEPSTASHALGHSYFTSVVWTACHLALGFALLHVSAGFNEMLAAVATLLIKATVEAMPPPASEAAAAADDCARRLSAAGGDISRMLGDDVATDCARLLNGVGSVVGEVTRMLGSDTVAVAGESMPPIRLKNTCIDVKSSESVCAGVAFSLIFMLFIRISHKGFSIVGHKGRVVSYLCRIAIASTPFIIFIVPKVCSYGRETCAADDKHYHKLWVPIATTLAPLVALCFFDRVHRAVIQHAKGAVGGLAKVGSRKTNSTQQENELTENALKHVNSTFNVHNPLQSSASVNSVAQRRTADIVC